MTPPLLRTDRLTLRPWSEADFTPYAQLCADPEVMCYLGDPKTPGEAWRHLAMMVGHWHLKGFGHWAVSGRDDPRLIGRIGL